MTAPPENRDNVFIKLIDIYKHNIIYTLHCLINSQKICCKLRFQSQRIPEIG